MEFDEDTAKRLEMAVRDALNPLKMYDPATDQWRVVTQADVDKLVLIANAYALIQNAAQNAAKAIEEGRHPLHLLSRVA